MRTLESEQYLSWDAVIAQQVKGLFRAAPEACNIIHWYFNLSCDPGGTVDPLADCQVPGESISSCCQHKFGIKDLS